MPDAGWQEDGVGEKMDLEAWQSKVTSWEEALLNVASWCFNLKGHGWAHDGSSYAFGIEDCAEQAVFCIHALHMLCYVLLCICVEGSIYLSTVAKCIIVLHLAESQTKHHKQR
jgi:hypothetical protein